MPIFSSLQNYVILLVLIFCVEFQELSHLRRAQSEAEKKMLLQAEEMHKMTTISLKMVEVVILSENNCHFVSCSACNSSNFLETIAEIQYRK